MSEHLENILKTLPSSPGIYQYFDRNGEILYVGKSVNLKSRVQSYFNGKSKLNFAKQKMVQKIADIRYIVVNNETESLILETNLIKTHKPKYNILMKDDKNHLYIKITKAEFPKIIKTRIGPNSRKKDGEYFGPYLNGNYVAFILKFIKKHFGYGVGPHNFFVSKQSYNLDKYLFKGNLLGNKDVENTYQEKISQIRDFIKSDYKKVIPKLEEEMKNYAKNLEFEQAQKVKETIEAIQSLEINQIARDGIIGDYDIVQFLEKYEKIYIGYIKIRENKIIGMQNFQIENKLELESQEIIKNFIEQHILVPHIEEGNHKKLRIILPDSIKIHPHIPFPQEEKGNSKIATSSPLGGGLRWGIEFPKIGAKKELLELAYKNIYEYAYKQHIAGLSVKGFTKKTMLNLLEILGYEQINKNIVFECNDISHLSGNYTVASRSVIENGKTNPKKYRKYKIKTLAEQKIDDFASMREVMTRRLKEIQQEGNIPDLIIIDGGKGQLGSVVKIVEEFKKVSQQNLTSNSSPAGEENSKQTPTSRITGEKEVGSEVIDTLQIVSIAKREEELFIWKNGAFERFVLDKNSDELRLTQKIRDEAHRFAITFNRDSRSKAMKKNILESLPGFGPVTRKKLLKTFGSIENLKNIDKEELKKHINKNQIETLQDHGIID